ncbi:MAG: type II toxin-antitoxin system VapC family toxin [Rhodospirillales bacterium]
MVDAAVAVKWVVAEDHSEQAASILRYGFIHAPAHWLAEAINALWAKAARGDVAHDGAVSRAAGLRQAPVRPAALADLVEPALQLALTLGVTVYDSLHIALAQSLGAAFVTADLGLLRKVAAPALPAGLVRRVGDLHTVGPDPG